MSLASRKSSSVEEDLRAMLDCNESDDEDLAEDDAPNKEDILRRAQDWQSLPADFIRTYTKDRKSAKCQNRVPNVWSFPKANCLRHQTENTTCRCGIGKGFTFLLENLDNKEFASNIEASDFNPNLNKSRNPAKNIATLIPEELHVKKYQNKGSLELIQDEYTVHGQDHEAHQTRVPSRTPVTRGEVLRLKDVLRRLLHEAGMGENLSQVVLERRTDSEIEKLVELVRAEQDVYNIVFHEIIRQVTVDCSERGEILSELRDFYARLLGQIPQIVMAVHEENIVQRSLDRRLMEELLHFKIRLVQVVLGLDNVHHVYQQTKGRMCTAQEELKHSLIEAQNTSRISDQLHELYKMQKQRQEHETRSNARQREFWKNATCSIIAKVVNVYKLGLFRFLATSLDTWVQLAHKIMEERETKDNEQLELNFAYLRDWLGKVEDIIFFMNNREQRVFNFANRMWHSLDAVANQLKAAVNPDPAEFLVTPSEGGKAVTIHKALVQWTSQFTVDLGQVEDGLAGSSKTEKCLSRLEGIRESWRFQTQCHILLPIRDESFRIKVGKSSGELTDMMKAVHPLLDEAFYQGIDPTIHKVEVGVRMWAKRNLRVGDLARLQTELAKWSTSLQRSCDDNGYLQWDGRRATYSVVRERLTEKVDQYRAAVVECLTNTLHDSKLELADLQDRVTQWTVECLVLAAPYHPSIPEPARRMIEDTMSSVPALGSRQQEIKGRLAIVTDALDHSWQLVQDQGGRTYGDVGIDPDTLSEMFRTEGQTWAGLSDTCMAKLKSGEMFEPDVTACDIGVNTEEPVAVANQATSTEDVTLEVERKMSSTTEAEGADLVSASAVTFQDDSPGATGELLAAVPSRVASPDSRRPSIEVSGATSSTTAPPYSLDWRGSVMPPGGGRPSLLVPSTSGEVVVAVPSREASPTRRRPSAKPSDVTSAVRGSPSSRGRRGSRATPRRQSRPTPSGSSRLSVGAASQPRVTPSSIGPGSAARGRSHAGLVPSASSRLGHGLQGVRSPSGSVSYRSLSGRRSSLSSRSRSRTRRNSSRRRPTLLLQPPEIPEPEPVERPPSANVATEAALPRAPQAERAAQTEHVGHLHPVTFPDFMIELFAREMVTSGSGQLVISTDEERERMTALQLHVEQLQQLKHRLSERELNVQELHIRLAAATDDISELTHKLRVAELKLENAQSKLRAEAEESGVSYATRRDDDVTQESAVLRQQESKESNALEQQKSESPVEFRRGRR